MGKKWYDIDRYNKSKEYRHEVIKANVGVFFIKIVFTFVYGIILLFVGSGAITAFTSPLFQISLLNILELIVTIVMLYLIMKVWVDDNDNPYY